MVSSPPASGAESEAVAAALAGLTASTEQIVVLSRIPRTGASSPRPLYLTECLLIGPKENAA